MVVRSVCVEAPIYEFVYSKKCGELRGPSRLHEATSTNNILLLVYVIQD
jgi:hypothetical protein